MIGKYMNYLIKTKRIILGPLRNYTKLNLGKSFSINLLEKNTYIS